MQIDPTIAAGTQPVAQSPAAPVAPPGAVSAHAGDPLPTLSNPGPPPGQPMTPWPQQPQMQMQSVLTPNMVRDELVTIGVPPTNDNVVIAQVLAKLAIPLTPQMMADAHVALAAAGPEAMPASFGLAKSLNLPASPGVLRGLSSVISASGSGGQATGMSISSLLQSFLPAVLAPEMSNPVDAVVDTAEVTSRRDLPIELLQRLGLTVDFNAAPAELATKMQAYSRQVLKSTEERIADALAREGDLGEINDLRTLLLRMAGDALDPEIRDGAAALASHIEGQQLVNAGSQASHMPENQVGVYVALPMLLAGEQSLIEMRLWPRKDDRSESWTDEDAYPIRATVRLSLSLIGRVQADVQGDLSGYLRCLLTAEKQGVMQVMARNTDQLSTALAHAGWARNEITCDTRSQWPPLWKGGDALAKPRQRVDWRA